MHGLKTASARTGDIDSIRIDFGAREQVVECPQTIPYFPTCQVSACQVSQIAEHRVLCADQVVPALPCFHVPELTALALTDRVPRQHYIPALNQSLTQCLIVSLAVRRVSCRDENGWTFCPPAPTALIRHIKKCRNVNAGEA